MSLNFLTKNCSGVEQALNILHTLLEKLSNLQVSSQNQLNVFNDANAEYQAELQRSIENARLEDNEESKKIQKYSAELQQYQAEVAAEVQEYQQNLDGGTKSFADRWTNSRSF